MERIEINKLILNTGQIEGLPKNPRFIRDEKYKLLVKSIQTDPEMLTLRELLVFPYGDKYIVLGGNMRLRAMKELGFSDAPVKVIPSDTPMAKLKAILIKDNVPYGEWNFDDLANEWELDELKDFGLDFPDIHISAPTTDDETADEKNITCPECGVVFKEAV